MNRHNNILFLDLYDDYIDDLDDVGDLEDVLLDAGINPRPPRAAVWYRIYLL